MGVVMVAHNQHALVEEFLLSDFDEYAVYDDDYKLCCISLRKLEMVLCL